MTRSASGAPSLSLRRRPYAAGSLTSREEKGTGEHLIPPDEVVAASGANERFPSFLCGHHCHGPGVPFRALVAGLHPRLKVPEPGGALIRISAPRLITAERLISQDATHGEPPAELRGPGKWLRHRPDRVLGQTARWRKTVGDHGSRGGRPASRCGQEPAALGNAKWLSNTSTPGSSSRITLEAHLPTAANGQQRPW